MGTSRKVYDPFGGKGLGERFVLDEMYYEENNVIPKKEYERMINTLEQGGNYRPAKPSVIRKIFFNKEINYLTDAVSVNHENSESYCVMMTDWENERLMLEKKSVREGLIRKSHAYLSEEQFEKIVDGDYEWLKNSKEMLLQDLYLQLTINELRPGVVVDYTRRSFRLNNRSEYMIFDSSIRSTYVFTKDTLLSPLLVQKERLEPHHIVMTYKKTADLPEYICQMIGIGQGSVRLLPEPV